MNFVFVLFKYFPFGGLQRDMIAATEVGLRRGHRITVFCSQWQGDIPQGLEVKLLPVKALTNAAQMRKFSHRVSRLLEKGDFDAVVGFNKLPDLDVYYAADSCFAAKAFEEKSFLYRLSPRARTYLAYEAAVFDSEQNTKVFELSPVERDRYQRYYQTPDPRFFTLPPGIWPQYRSAVEAGDARSATRSGLGINADALVLIMVGSGFKTKGLDRSIQLLADLNASSGREAILLVAGQDNPKRYEKLASHLGVQRQLRFLGGRNDVPSLLQAADVLVHPARKENTGNVLLEAMIAGCPVIATDVCGYSHYIEDAEMGVVMPSPFNGRAFLKALEQIVAENSKQWRERGREFARREELYARPERVIDLLEQHCTASSRSAA
ncbi:glycosyltransferase family 4 protein [Proteobacteria bacterium 005FR1]|nr:glycosyltransferase family 4 protein [Proteobacteria bacterium 005FR1]